jgi:hypothetical protein
VRAERLLTGIGGGLVLIAVFAIASATLTRFDIWAHLKAGEVIVATRSLPATDPFAFTAEGRPWHNPVWGSQVVLFALWVAGGGPALTLFKGLAVAGALSFVLLTLRDRGVHPVAAWSTILFLAWGGARFWETGPQLFTYLGMALLVWLLRPGWPGRPRLALAVPLTLAAWVNLDSGFVAGLALIAAVGLGTAAPEIWAAARRPAGWRVLCGSAVLTGLAIAGSFANPAGPRVFLHLAKLTSDRASMLVPQDWFSPNFLEPSYRGFALGVLLLIGAFAWGRERLGTPDILVSLAALHLALSSARYVPLFLIVAAAPVADGLTAAARLLWSRQTVGSALLPRLGAGLPTLAPLLWRRVTPVAGGVLGLLVVVAVHLVPLLDPTVSAFAMDLDERRYPREAVTFILRERLPAPLYNVHAWGGYELWRLYPTYRIFMDGRPYVYDPDVVRDFLDVGQLSRRWKEVLERREIQTILALRRSPLVQALQRTGEWRLVFVDGEAVVLVREATRHEALLARLPAIALDDGAPVPPVVVAMADAFRAAASGDEEGALRRYQDALALEPDHLLALYSLGVLREKRGEHREARALFERLAERAPESELADQARVRLRTLR